MPQAPDDADDNGGAKERPSFKLLEQIAAPAHFFAKGEKAINGGTCQHARQEGDCRCSHRAEGQCFAECLHDFGVGVDAAYPVGEEQR